MFDESRMKRIVILVSLLALCCVASAYIAYHLGYQKSHDQAQLLRYGNTIVSLDALEDLRSGDISNATRKVEGLCFVQAAMIYGDPRFQRRFAGRTNAAWSAEVRQYLDRYHTNRTEWTPTVVRLERDLAQWP
jgi:uncharacterized membrane protein